MEFLLLAVAAFLAGGLNALAGGGTFLTLPALIFTGVPAIEANATSALAVMPGYFSSALGFRRAIGPVNGVGVPALVGVSLVGALGGALLLLSTPAPLFRGIVPWLMLLATLMFAFGPLLVARLRADRPAAPVAVLAALFAVSVYGGYFNGGLGILLLAAFSLLGLQDLVRANGLKSVLSAALTLVSVATFASAGVIRWPEAAVMMVASTAGGYAGAHLAQRLPTRVLRIGIVVVGLGMTVLFFLT